MNPATVPPALLETAPAVTRVFGTRPFQADGDLLALAFAADGTLWSVEEPSVLRQWDPATNRQLAWRLLSDLATVTHNTMAMPQSPDAAFMLYPKLTPAQDRAFQLLGVPVKL